MANQIAANVMLEDDPIATTSDHIQKFWDPRMKAMIVAQGSEGLSPIAAAAIARLNVAS